eukprot:Transcript_14284.p1 GENE.Transcript_14284~~Transcript_14284.p1  ORF type:complete len:664 (-),score=253.09 Transcript_14284:82-2073(-)
MSSSSSDGKKRRLRHSMTADQVARLVEVFELQTHPPKKMREELSEELGVPATVIQTWFQNRRARSGSRTPTPPNSTGLHELDFGELVDLAGQGTELKEPAFFSGELPSMRRGSRRREPAAAAVDPPPLPAKVSSLDVFMTDLMAGLPSRGDGISEPSPPDEGMATAAAFAAMSAPQEQTTKTEANVRVMRDLCVHGEAWKAGGSTQWRVLSDARVKDVLSTFALGGGTLAHVVPRLFRYRGQPEHERPYAGIIAQELPPELAPFCRFRTDLPALATDAALDCPPSPTGEGRAEEGEGLYLVDLSALQFVILNAASELQRRVADQAAEIASLRAHPGMSVPAAVGGGGKLFSPPPPELVSVLTQYKPHTDFTIHPVWLVFNDPEARALYHRHFHATKGKDVNASAVIKAGTAAIWVMSTLAIATHVRTPADLASAAFWTSRQILGELLNVVIGSFFYVMWHAPVARRYPRLVDTFFLWAATMLILVEVSRVCYLNNSGEGICGLYDEPTQMRSSLIGQEHLRWFTFVGLALPLILVAFMNGIPWAAVVASQTATAAFMWPYAMHEYTAAELPGELTPAVVNCKMLLFFVTPHLSMLVLAYTRLRATLQLAATAMRERQAAETFKALYEAAQLEMPEPAGSRTAPQRPQRLFTPCQIGVAQYNMV